MDRAAKCCLAWLNPDQEFLPTGGYEVAHDTGRWWDAMLRYEAATGTRIPEQAEAAMMKNLRPLTDNPAALLMNTARLPGPAEKIKVNPHNLRETMLAYTALVRHRKSDWARTQGLKLSRRFEAVLDTDGQLDYQKLAAVAGGPLTADPLMIQRAPPGEWFNATATTGRAIEAIVWFHEATGDAFALKLAQRLAEVHLRHTIDPAGEVRSGTSRSGPRGPHALLLRDAARTAALRSRQRREALCRCGGRHLSARALGHGHQPLRLDAARSGQEPLPRSEGDPVGEHASCGDVAQIALWLALRAGQTDLLDDVERLIRARLLPSQIIDEQHPRRDGAWGVYAHPFGYGAILDVFAAVLHSLADFHEHIVTTTGEGIVSVNLHFDIDTPSVTVKSKRDGKATLRHHAQATLRPADSGSRMGLARFGAVEHRRSAGAFDLGRILSHPFKKRCRRSEDVITLQHDLPVRTTIEEMPVSHRKFQLTWRGDEVISCDPKVPIYRTTNG